MRAMIVAALAMTASAAIADEIDDAHRLARVGARFLLELSGPGIFERAATRPCREQDFTALIASVCPSERQNFRVTLVDYLSLQFPGRRCGSPS